MISKGTLLDIAKKLLKTDRDLSFLLELSYDDLRLLVICIRERIDTCQKYVNPN